MSTRVTRLALVVAVVGAGWWAASEAGATAWEQIGAAVAASLSLRWVWRNPTSAPGAWDAAAVGLAAGGLALGWAWPAAAALACMLARQAGRGLERSRVAAMAIVAVPWIAADAAMIGWWFRWSGAWAAGGIFQLSGLAVTRAGTSLQLEDQPLTVDAACAGLDTLQVTLVAGLWLAEALRTERAWRRVAWALPFFAWGANTLRIVVLGAVAVAAGHEAAKGWFHQWGGLAVVVCVFVLAGAWVAWLARGEASARRTEGTAS